jgi:hypothetical protein
MAEDVRKMMYVISARIYAGMSIVFLVVYTTLALYEHFTGSDQWTAYFLIVGFGLFLLFYIASGIVTRRALNRA